MKRSYGAAVLLPVTTILIGIFISAWSFYLGGRFNLISTKEIKEFERLHYSYDSQIDSMETGNCGDNPFFDYCGLCAISKAK